MSDRKTKKQSKQSKKQMTLVWKLIMLVAVVVLAVSLWQLSSILLEYHEGEQDYEEILSHMDQVEMTLPEEETEEAAEEPEESQTAQTGAQDNEGSSGQPARFSLTVPDFAYLQSVNSDVVGWIQIPGTNINYPIVQGSDNEYYLTHTFSGTDNSGGAIFLDAAIGDGLDDKNPIIHGHNLRSGTMFSRLNRYARRDFWDANRYIYITTPEGLRVYEVFSAYEVQPDADIYYFGFGSDDTFQAYIDRVMSYSIYDAGMTVTKDDSIVTLSTCANDTTLRFVVHAKRI